MATVTKAIVLDESINTTESPSRNVADVLAQELSGIASAITGGSDKAPKTNIATVEPTNVASRAYSIGELVYVNGNLYKAITAISGGATFTVGTNIQSANVSNRVKEVDNSVSALNTKLTPQALYDGDVSFTSGQGWLANSAFNKAHFMPTTAQCIGAAVPCVVSLDNASAGVFVTLPSATGFTGTLRVIIYGIGWN